MALLFRSPVPVSGSTRRRRVMRSASLKSSAPLSKLSQHRQQCRPSSLGVGEGEGAEGAEGEEVKEGDEGREGVVTIM